MARYYKYSSMPYRIILPDGSLGDAMIPDGVIGCRQDRPKYLDDLIRYKNAVLVYSTEDVGCGWVKVLNDFEIPDDRFDEVEADTSDGEIRHALFAAIDRQTFTAQEVARIPAIVAQIEGDDEQAKDAILDLKLQLSQKIAAEQG